MVKKIDVVTIIGIIVLTIPFAIYIISLLFVSNTVSEPLSTTTDQAIDKNTSL